MGRDKACFLDGWRHVTKIAGRRGRNAIRDDRATPFAAKRFAVDQTRVLA